MLSMAIYNPKDCFISLTEVGFHSFCNMENACIGYNNKARAFIQFAIFCIRKSPSNKQNASSIEVFLGRFTLSPAFPVKLCKTGSMFASIQTLLRESSQPSSRESSLVLEMTGKCILLRSLSSDKVLVSNKSMISPSYYLLSSLEPSYNIRLFFMKDLLDRKIYLLLYDSYLLYDNNIYSRLLTYLLSILAIIYLAKLSNITEYTRGRVNILF